MGSKQHEKMEESDSVGEEYSTDSSTKSVYGVEVNLDGFGDKDFAVNPFENLKPINSQGAGSSGGGSESAGQHSLAPFGAGFQEMLIRAMFQSTAAMMGPSGGLLSSAQATSTGSPLLSTEALQAPSTWKESTFTKSEAKREKTMRNMRTSAGEGSDSQEEFRKPVNESRQQKSVRTRRLNRYQGRRSKELTNNRKAINKLPYVIHMDGAGFAKGIHRHKWRAAVRGQCGRLDPTMANMNHHPKHVVDSIWQALEKEWEFEGFVHRSREMFEKSATKSMRNRKMQLKKKFKNSVNGKKPDHVSPSHWSKIKQISKRQPGLCASASTGATGEEKMIPDEAGGMLLLEFGDKEFERNSPVVPTNSGVTKLEEDDVDAHIRSLQNELLRLQKSREDGFRLEDKIATDCAFHVKEVEVVISRTPNVPYAGSEDMKEDTECVKVCEQVSVVGSTGKATTEKESVVQVKVEDGTEESNTALFWKCLCKVNPNNLANTNMDCRDVIRMYACIGGKKKEVAKGIVMALAGSKFARKVIPQGWRLVKITSYTSNAATVACPIPTGWAGQVKQQTVKEATGRSIAWLDSQLHSILHI